ncbi:MAG: TRAP transporter small permease subunit [Paracoccaceae bacterium]|nr:TRAP transporter small permease subunit [Paracoccaceae bacterium]
MEALLSFANVLDRISRGVGKFASWLILPLIFLIMFDVVTRKIDFIKDQSAEITIKYGFSVSFILQDLQWHVHGALLLLTFGFGYLRNAHVRVDIFRENVSRRKQVWVEFLGLVICAVPFLALMIWFSWVMTSSSFAQGEGSESQVGLGWRFIIKSFLVWGFGIALVAALATLFRCIAYLWGNDEQRAAAEEQLQFFTDIEVLPKVHLDDEEEAAGTGGPAHDC